MKANFVLRLIPPLWILTIMFFLTGCVEEVLKIEPTSDSVTSIIPIYNYKWDKRNEADTIIFQCNQRITYSLDEEDIVLSPLAVVKLYPIKDTVFFYDNEKPDTIYSDENTTSENSGNAPNVNIIRKDFYFTDGQNVRADIYYEKYNLTIGDVDYTLPYVVVNDISFVDVTVDEILNEENLYLANLDFTLDWSINENQQDNINDISIFYIKKMLLGDDELLDVSYSDSYIWHNSKQFSIFVEKTETWKYSGEHKTTYTSPVLDFYISGKEDTSLNVDNLNFEYIENSNLSDVKEITSDGWTIKHHTKYITITHSNGIQSFSNDFEFPIFEISLSIDGKSFNFDLKQKYTINTKVVTEDNKNTHTTNVNALLLNRRFEAYVFTNLNVNEDNPSIVEPEPEPDPTPDPEIYKYGKIVDYSVTAIYDADATFGDGKITKKCVMIRFERGYLWGVCEYQDDFPKEYTYSTSGYSGFNSVTRNEAFKPFELARAVDVNEGIAWYSENNKLIAGIDVLTCKILGWENAINGKYSAFINSYDAKYSNNRYTLTLTAPNGVSKTIYSE
jgi:hypothetical protein